MFPAPKCVRENYEPHKAKWLLCAVLVYTFINFLFCAQFVFLSVVFLRVHKDYFLKQHLPLDISMEVRCFLWDRNWIFKHYLDKRRPQSTNVEDISSVPEHRPVFTIDPTLSFVYWRLHVWISLSRLPQAAWYSWHFGLCCPVML